MNEKLTWLESIIVRRNLRTQHLAGDSNVLHDEDSDKRPSTPPKTGTSWTSDYYSARGSVFDPFDSPPPATPELPALPHSKPSSAASLFSDPRQQLLDILNANIPPATDPNTQADLYFEEQGMSGWTNQPEPSQAEATEPKAWPEQPRNPPAESGYASPGPENRPICQAYLSGTCRNGASCVYKHSLPSDREHTSGFMSIGQQPRQSDSDRGTMSSSSGTPSDQHRSPALNQNGWSSSGQAVKGWTPPSSNQPLPQGMQNAPGPTGMSGYTTANPSNKPVNVDYAWTAPPQQSNIYNYNHNDNGRPLSPDGWPVRKEAIRGHTEPVPDLLSGYIQKKEAAAVPGKSSGWKTTSSNVSRNTITAAKDTPLPLSEVDNRGLSRPPRHVPSPGPSPPAQTAPAASNWRTSTPKSVKSPVLVAPIAPVPIAPVHVSGAVQTAALAPTSASANSPPNNAQDRPTSQTVRVVSGWTVKVPFGRDEDVVAVLPVPIVPQQYSQQPSQQNIASSSTAPPEEPSSDATEAWVLPSVDAVKNNNWTSTTRRSRVSRVEQTPTYIRASSPGRKESDFITSDGRGHGYSASGSRFGNDDNSIRPSESASNVGVADETSYGRSDRQPVSQDRNSQAHPRFKPMRQFQGEKDTDIGSNASSGSLNDNPNAMAGGWQRSTAAHVVHETMDRQPAFEMSKSPGYNSHASQHHQPQLHNLRQGEPPGLQGRYAQQYANGESRRTPITAPMPRRWDSSSQKLVGDLERAATPRMAQGVSAGTGHGRSTSTTSGAKGSMSIRGASKYHAESLMLREELDKIRSQVAKYETVLSSLDSAEDRHDAELEREVQTLKQENHDLRSRVGQLEAERDEMRNALQPVLRVLGLIAGKTQKNGGHADHLGDYINGHASTSLQDLTMISKGDVSRQTQPRAVGW